MQRQDRSAESATEGKSKPRRWPRTAASWQGTRPIVLIGLMGAGKTTIGLQLAKAIGWKFVDSDAEIVEAAGCSIADMFAIHGEAIFRDLEQRVISRLLDSPQPVVMATGGGAWMQAPVRERIQSKAVSVWLRADIDVLVERVSRKTTRPLLEQGDKRAILTKLMTERYPVYEKADLVVDSGDGAHHSVVKSIMREVKAFEHARAEKPA